jgi:hypothetical protein
MAILALKDWRDYPDGREKYNLYLASREWAVLKEAVRARSGGVCERCRNADGQQVHHQTYERKYAEQLEDLVHTCAPCHEFLSGKRAADPVLEAPPRIMGRPIQSVYLAGKITGTKWRDQIVAKGWSFENHSAIDFELEAGIWHTIHGCLPIPDGRKLDLTGPYWRPFHDRGGHSDITDASGLHAYQKLLRTDGVVGLDPELPKLTDQIESSIRCCDLVFAWIDSLDCYGTFVELGIARALNRVVVVSHPPDFDGTEVWLAIRMGHICGLSASPADAWRELWTTPVLAGAPPRNL